AVLEIAQDGERVLDQLVRFAPLDVGNEADAAGILVERRVVETLRSLLNSVRAMMWRAHPMILAASPAQTAGADLRAAQLRRPAVAVPGAAASSAPLLLWQPSRPLLSRRGLTCKRLVAPNYPGSQARGRSCWAAGDATAPLITVQCG